MSAGISLIGFIVPIIIGFASIAVLVTIVVIAIKGVKGKGGKVDDGQTSEDKKATAEEINRRIQNLFAGLNQNAAQNSSEQPKEKTETKNEVKDQRCKNCGASLAEDKNGKLHCPYCQSKYF